MSPLLLPHQTQAQSPRPHSRRLWIPWRQSSDAGAPTLWLNLQQQGTAFAVGLLVEMQRARSVAKSDRCLPQRILKGGDALWTEGDMVLVLQLSLG